MPGSRSIIRRLTLAATLAATSIARGADQPLKVEVQHSVATLDSAGGHVTYMLKFDLHLLNKSAAPMSLPTVETSDENSISVLGMEYKSLRGPWTSLFQTSFYGSGEEKYEQCTTLAPARTKEIVGITKRFSLLRKQLSDLGVEPTFRLYLMVSCRRLDGSVISPAFLTEGFTLRLPPP